MGVGSDCSRKCAVAAAVCHETPVCEPDVNWMQFNWKHQCKDQ